MVIWLPAQKKWSSSHSIINLVCQTWKSRRTLVFCQRERLEDIRRRSLLVGRRLNDWSRIRSILTEAVNACEHSQEEYGETNRTSGTIRHTPQPGSENSPDCESSTWLSCYRRRFMINKVGTGNRNSPRKVYWAVEYLFQIGWITLPNYLPEELKLAVRISKRGCWWLLWKTSGWPPTRKQSLLLAPRSLRNPTPSKWQ